MIDPADPVIAPRGLTKNQLVQEINKQCGGWPYKAFAIYAFESADPAETVYRFVDEQGIAFEKTRYRLLDGPLWEKRLTRDEYLLHMMSRAGKAAAINEATESIIERLRGTLR